MGLENGYLSLEAEHTTMHYWLIGDNSCIVQKIACGEVVGAINDNIVLVNQTLHVGLIQTPDIGHNLDIRIERGKRLTRRLGFILANTPSIMQNLTLQIAIIHGISINNTKSSNPGSCQII